MLGIPLYTLITGFNGSAACTVILLFPIIWALALASMVRGFGLTKNQLIVKRPLWNNTFKLDPGAKAYQKKLSSITIRTFGNGGAFSGSGYFWNKEIGKFRAFITDPSDGVWIETPEKTLLITPDNPDEFLKKFNALKQYERN
jgi:hypothetical protein